MEAAAVEGDNAGGLLAAVLQGVQAERGDRGGLGVAEDAEHAAFLAERVAIKIGVVSEIVVPVVLSEMFLLFDRPEVEIHLGGVIGRGLHLVHRLSQGAQISYRPAGFSISFFKPSRAGLL
ncbi:hypothetical protein BraRD5C2_49830 [Bradyrhizobium sp. RD5-C2]|nr:hypothetical protein BraRD5C2_49830 [Bradyrhizobium sp. RD5-C2]